MSDHNQHAHNPALGPGYETSDANTGPLVALAIATFLMVAGAALVVAIMWRAMAFASNYMNEGTGSVMADQRTPPPEPRLQINEPRDLYGVREWEKKQVEGYTWVDKEKGVVRIPVDRALDIIAERGLPAAPPQPKKPAAGATKQGVTP